jgi:hypothetical protein
VSKFDNSSKKPAKSKTSSANQSHKSLLSRLFSNNKFLILLSFIIAFSSWMVVSINSDEEVSLNITGVPVTVNLSDVATAEGLKVFSGADTTVTVVVQGNSLTVRNLQSSDFQVVAQNTSDIITPGTYPVDLVAKKSGFKTDYSIVSVLPATVNLFVDRPTSKDFDIVNNLSYEVTPNYYSSANFNPLISISGPESLVKKVDRVEINGEIKGVLQQTTDIEQPIILYDVNNNVIDEPLLSYIQQIPVKIAVMPQKKVPLTVSFANTPAGLSGKIKYSITPNTIQIAAEQSALDAIKDVTLDPIDFRQLAAGQQKIVKTITLPADCKNINNTTEAEVVVDFSGYATHELSATTFKSENIPSGFNIMVITQNITVQVVGPKDEVAKLTAADITGVLDFSQKQDNSFADGASMEMPVVFEVNTKYKNCWVKGEYTANVEVSAD